MHSKHIKTFRPYTVIFLIKIVDGFKKTCPSYFSNKSAPPPKKKKKKKTKNLKVRWVYATGVYCLNL
jgi:hypothetical protein